MAEVETGGSHGFSQAFRLPQSSSRLELRALFLRLFQIFRWPVLNHLLALQIPASVMHFIEKCFELAGACGVAKLAQGLSFDLANAFASDCKPPANLLQRVLRSVFPTKARLDHFIFTRAQGV